MTVMGGLTVLEAILLAIWITLNVVMLWNWYYYYTEPYDYGESTRLHKNQVKSMSKSMLTSCKSCKTAHAYKLHAATAAYAR